MIPGSNILSLALTVIASQVVNWFAFASSTDGSTGLVVSTYAVPQTVPRGSVQPVPRSRYEAYGLDWAKSYVTWYVPNVNALPITRDPSGNGDVIEWPVNLDGSLIAGKTRRYQIVGDDPWQNIDGWTGVICLDIGVGTGATTNA